MSRWIKLAVSLSITFACLWWTFRGTSASEMLISLKGANWLVLVPYFVMLLVIHLSRTLRWGNLLSGMETVPFKKLNEASAIGFMMLIILPFRLGEFARPFLVAQRSGIRRSAAMTSVVLERIIDGVSIAILLKVLMFFVPGDSEGIRNIKIGANVMFGVFGGGLVFLLLARWKHDPVIALIRRTVGRLAPGPTEKVVGILDGFVGALRQLPDRRNMALFFMWTVIYWAVNGWGMSFFANAFDCSAGLAENCTPLHLSVFQGFVVLCVVIAGMMIPAAPGSAGTFQLSITLAISVFMPVTASAKTFASVIWIVQILQQVVVGLYFLITSHSSFSEIAGRLGAEKADAGRASSEA